MPVSAVAVVAAHGTVHQRVRRGARRRSVSPAQQRTLLCRQVRTADEEPPYCWRSVVFWNVRAGVRGIWLVKTGHPRAANHGSIKNLRGGFSLPAYPGPGSVQGVAIRPDRAYVISRGHGPVALQSLDLALDRLASQGRCSRWRTSVRTPISAALALHGLIGPPRERR